MPAINPFLDFIANPHTQVEMSVGLYRYFVDLTQPVSLASFLEPIFDGYRRAPSSVFSRRQLIGAGGGLVSTGLLLWVVSSPFPSAQVYGHFVTLSYQGQTSVVAAEAYKQPIRTAEIGDRVGRIVTVAQYSVTFNPGA